MVVRALGRLGDYKVIDAVLPMLQRDEKEIRLEAITSLAKLADERRLEAIRVQIQAQTANRTDRRAGGVARALGSRLALLGERQPPLLDPESPDFSTPRRPIASPRRRHAGHRAHRMRRARRRRRRPRGHDPEAPRRRKLPSRRARCSCPRRKWPRPSNRPRSWPGRRSSTSTTLKPGDIIEGRYKYVERIGKGAFGTVLLMEDTVVDERLILKFLNPNVSEDEEIMKRFVHELRYSRKITHHNVIRIYDFLYIQGNYAISMEYFPSHTLGSEVVGEKPMPLARALGFGIDICTGMEVAHAQGIVHRDLKPANVLINAEGLLKIVDFGVAAAQREGDTQLTKTGYVIGSPKYMAPEQILGKKVDQRADVYALGVILYEIMTGVPPYARGDHMSVMYQHVQGKARPPREINPGLPAGLPEVIMQAMSVDKDKRYQTMVDLRAALEKYR